MMQAWQHDEVETPESDDVATLVTMRIDGQILGIPVEFVHSVLKEQPVTLVPLAPADVVGLINLRGRVATIMNTRERLRLASKIDTKPSMFVVIEYQQELCGLVVDSVGEIMHVPHALIEDAPVKFSENWKRVASGIHRLEGEFLVIFDPESFLNIQNK